MNVLFASSEAFPLIKTGGLGDISNSLPNSLVEQGADVRLVMPAYREVLKQLDVFRILGWIRTTHQEVRVLVAEHPAFSMPLWLIDQGELFDREGNPYLHPEGYDWPDNPQRFNTFSQAAALLAMDVLKTGWKADVVHANDWQTGMVAAHLSHESHPPKRIFTIHNIAYDCQFDYGAFQSMRLPPYWWSMEFGEFYGRFSMLKAGMIFSDEITTVSPRYAEEIRTPEYGYGYAPILDARAGHLHGVLNGIDTSVWNPATDQYLVKNYSVDEGVEVIRDAKAANRQELLRLLGANKRSCNSKQILVGFVGRLVFQKGIDLLLNALEALLPKKQARFVIIGTGEAELEQQLKQLAEQYPQRLFCYLGYSEEMAHLLEAGADLFVMPSRYEPCGLNQLYSLRYGTPALVRNTGGLADTVVNTTAATLKSATATGFIFDEADSEALQLTLGRAIRLFKKPSDWSTLLMCAMQQDFGWHRSAQRYLELYQQQ